MAYARIGAVEQWVGMGFRASAQSTPTNAMIKTFLERHTRAIDYELRNQRITIPVTGSTALETLEDLNAMLSAIDALRTMNPGNGDEQQQAQSQIDYLQGETDALWRQLRSDAHIFLDITDEIEDKGGLPRRLSFKLKKLIPRPGIWNARVLHKDRKDTGG